MNPRDLPLDEEDVVVEVNRTQLQHFTGDDPRCRALQLPEGILLRYNLSESLYFYLRTQIEDGKIATRVFASNSPYEQQKASIGKVLTPMFEARADFNHLEKVKQLLHSWVEFVQQGADVGQDFSSFQVGERQEE